MKVSNKNFNAVRLLSVTRYNTKVELFIISDDSK